MMCWSRKAAAVGAIVAASLVGAPATRAVEAVVPARPRTTAAPARCPGTEMSGTVAATLDNGETVRLASGTVFRVADIRLAPGGAGERGRAWLATLAGRELRFRASSPDRWGRLAASGLSLVEGGAASGEAIAVAELLVSEGYALVDPGEADLLCDPALLVAEEKARGSRLGTWREAAVLDGADATAVAAAEGRFVVVEGRVVSVGERPARTYVNLGRFESGALTVTLPKRSWADLRRRGISAASLRGRRVRARGTIERWRSPVMEVIVADMLQVLDDQPARAR